MTPDGAIHAILDTALFAAYKHRNQRRKDAAASPYINHPLALAHTLAFTGGITDPEILTAALLHDTVEDSRSISCTSCANSKHSWAPSSSGNHRAVWSLCSGLLRDDSIVPADMGQVVMAVDARITKRRILIAAEGEDRGVHLLGVEYLQADQQIEIRDRQSGDGQEQVRFQLGDDILQPVLTVLAA